MNKLKGFKDLYPEDCLKRDKLVSLLKDFSLRFGYLPYDGPTLEEKSLYEFKSGDMILDETYSFKDKGGRDVVLRPEMTPTLARLLSKSSRSMRKPIRWFSIPNIFRYERSQKGRSREFIQYNADIIGESSILSEIEILSLSINILEGLGFLRDDFEIIVNDRQFIEEYISSLSSNVLDVLHLIDRKDKISDTEFKNSLSSILGSDKKTNEMLKFLESKDYSKSETLNDLFSKSLDFNLSLTFSPYLVRGFDYYTGIIFEIWDKQKKVKRAIFGGGRYDDLISGLGGEKLPAIGVATSDTILFALMDEYEKGLDIEISYDYFISTFPDISYKIYSRILESLRSKGNSVLMNINPTWSLTKQLEHAISCNVKYFIILGNKEINSGSVVVKDLYHNKENTIKLNDL